MFNRVKGTQDVLDMTLINFFLEKAKKHLQQYNFSEISTPILEPTELFKRSLGLETDVVSKEMYTVCTTGEEDESICLRPELTASTTRAFVNAGIQTLPWKVYSNGPMFRHERPQKGRLREFHQLNAEIIGAKTIFNDVQFIVMLDRFFHDLGLDAYTLLINFLGNHEDRAVFKKVLKEFLDGVSQGLCSDCLKRKEKNILRIFDCKVPQCQEIYKNAPRITDHLSAESQHEWMTLKHELERLSISFSVSHSLVRGLDYYDKTIFEFTSSALGSQSTFCGGGRYNSLAQQLGSKEDFPSLGCAIGIERIVLILETIKDRLALPQPAALHVFMPLAVEQNAQALMLADQLRARGLSAEVLLEGDSLKSMMRKANKLGATYALLLGADEQKEQKILIKNLIKSTQELVPQGDMITYLLK